MKFGGTSVRNKEAIERVISIVSNRMSENPLVVVSALSKVTRLLCEICKEAEAQHVDKVNELLADLFPLLSRFFREVTDPDWRNASPTWSPSWIHCQSSRTASAA